MARNLEKMGHDAFLPNGVLVDAIHKPDFDPVAVKHDNGYNAMREHFDRIKKADAILV